jgi:CRP-like cAMP-binding protein
VVGAAPFLLDQPPSAAVHAARDDTRVLALSRSQLDELGTGRPQLALQLTLNLARIVCTKLANVRTRALGSRTS